MNGCFVVYLTDGDVTNDYYDGGGDGKKRKRMVTDGGDGLMMNGAMEDGGVKRQIEKVDS